jgi:hypothetical protein
LAVAAGAEPPDYIPDPHGVIAWARRTTTSSVGNFEAGWALETTCSAAVDAGFTLEQIRRIVAQDLLARLIEAGEDEQCNVEQGAGC